MCFNWTLPQCTYPLVMHTPAVALISTCGTISAAGHTSQPTDIRIKVHYAQYIASISINYFLYITSSNKLRKCPTPLNCVYYCRLLGCFLYDYVLQIFP